MKFPVGENIMNNNVNQASFMSMNDDFCKNESQIVISKNEDIEIQNFKRAFKKRSDSEKESIKLKASLNIEERRRLI